MEEKLSIEQMTSCLKVMSDPTRFLMIKLAARKTYCVCEFVEMLEISQPGVSQHLRKLKELGLLVESRKAQWRYFSLNKTSPYYPVIETLLKRSDDEDERYRQALEREGLATC